MRCLNRTRTLGTLVAIVVVGGLTAASAASLGVSASSLTAYTDRAVIAAPPIITCDNFAKPSIRGNLVDGRPVQLPPQCGNQSWVTNTGTWRLTGGRANATGAHATVTLNAGRTDVSAEGTFINANSANRVGGITIAHSGGTSPRYLAAVLAGPNGVQLRISDGTTVTTIATGTATYGATTRLRVTLTGGVVTISLAGTVLLTHTLTAAQAALIAGNTRAGLYDNQGSVRFDDFLVTNPWAP